MWLYPCGKTEVRSGRWHRLDASDDVKVFVVVDEVLLSNAGDGLTDTLHGLSSSEVKSVVEWRDFYVRTYKFVGRLVGRYYDDQGQPTKHLKGAEAKAARGAQLLEKQKSEEEKVPSCNSKWSQDEGGEVWCDSGYPRLMQRPVEIALTGKASKRCVCLKEEELENPGLQVYEECDYLAKACKV
ncbi:hypothetical protein KSS87_003004 [Heliosperma pusillum]|nr:hypothetical protein KSS87_003004 [Heliosperma pusillum]